MLALLSDNAMTEVLLAAVVSMAGGFIWLIKSDTKTRTVLIQSLVTAVKSFREFERNSEKTSELLLDFQSKIMDTQVEVMKTLDRMSKRIEAETWSTKSETRILPPN